MQAPSKCGHGVQSLWYTAPRQPGCISAHGRGHNRLKDLQVCLPEGGVLDNSFCEVWTFSDVMKVILCLCSYHAAGGAIAWGGNSGPATGGRASCGRWRRGGAGQLLAAAGGRRIGGGNAADWTGSYRAFIIPGMGPWDSGNACSGLGFMEGAVYSSNVVP